MKRRFFLSFDEKEKLSAENFKVQSLQSLLVLLMRQREKEGLLNSDEIIFHYAEDLKESLRRKKELEQKIVTEYSCNLENLEGVTYFVNLEEGAIYFVYPES